MGRDSGMASGQPGAGVVMDMSTPSHRLDMVHPDTVKMIWDYPAGRSIVAPVVEDIIRGNFHEGWPTLLLEINPN